MIFGDCPYDGCTGFHALAVPERTPAFRKEKCETCGREFWLRYSRLDPEAYTLEDFEARFTVDETTRTIVEKNPKPEPELTDPEREAYIRSLEDAIINAFGTHFPVGMIEAYKREKASVLTVDSILEKLESLPKAEKTPDMIELSYPALDLLSGVCADRRCTEIGLTRILGIPYEIDSKLPRDEIHLKEWTNEGGIRRLRTYKIIKIGS